MRRLTNIIVLILFVFCFSVTALGCTRGDIMDFVPTREALTNNVVVHDPSIFYDEVTDKYYAFGSHFAVASSKDLITWKQEVNEYQPEKLYGTKDFRSILVKSDEFNGREGGINSTWAPDVIKYNDKYYMYYALTTAFGKGQSCIGRVSSDNILGPYSNEEVLIYSHDLWWEEPNAIDPELFYDKNGKLWMVYGSYFAGIYVIELYNSGEKFGLPIEKGFGKKICWDGYSSGVEGPFIFYSEETDYFYLMVSEGNLASNYNMRIARSKNPDGPYLDQNGCDMITPNGKGNKLSGNYRFEDEAYGHVALGHNSVIKKDGEYFCVYHERYGYDKYIYQDYSLKVRKLLFNADGWPMLAPNDYLGEEYVVAENGQISGEYDLVVHYKETIDDMAESEIFVFSQTGAILKDGIKVGNYRYKKAGYIRLKIYDAVYEGVAIQNYVKYMNANTISLSCISTEGVPLFANKIIAL